MLFYTLSRSGYLHFDENYITVLTEKFGGINFRNQLSSSAFAPVCRDSANKKPPEGGCCLPFHPDETGMPIAPLRIGFGTFKNGLKVVVWVTGPIPSPHLSIDYLYFDVKLLAI
jgi:hypothetical protein